MTTTAGIDLEEQLKRFGLKAFRPGQQEVIRAVLERRDCLCIMPTGGGKSLCYQLPAVAQDGLALVISPLIALMKDQVDGLVARGIQATFINSTLTFDEQLHRLDEIAAGRFDLVYVVPERFRSPRFLEAVRANRLQLLAVDEAHCVSEWGHDFRPDYARLGEFRRRLGNPPTIALTATATPAVREDIVSLLDLRDPQVFVTGFERPNLHHEVETCATDAQKDEAVIRFLQATPGSGIVYASTRKRCEEVCETIAARTRRAAYVYHAGMQGPDRRATQEAFMQGKAEIIVATNAFGMGIDKPDVRFVLHYNMPGTIEAYYQEAGRAGRDGHPSRCMLLYAHQDRYIQEYFIESAYPSRDVFARVYDFLCSTEDDPLEMTQEDIKDRLGLEIGTDGVGQCERLLAKARVLERLDPCQNMAVVSLSSDLPTLVEMLPTNAKVQRSALRAVEKLVGPRRYEMVYFHRRELAEVAGLDVAALHRALLNLRSLEAVEYVPPFRGRAIHMLRRDIPLEELDIDFDLLAERKAAEYEKLEGMIRYAKTGRCRQGEILGYFGERDVQPCETCDNCTQRASRRAAVGKGAAAASDGAVNDKIVEAVRMALSGVARTHGRFGRHLVAQMLCGSAASTITRFGLHKLSTHGLLAELTQSEAIELLDALISAGCIEQFETESRRPRIQLTSHGGDVMRNRAELSPEFQLPAELAAKLSGELQPSDGEDDGDESSASQRQLSPSQRELLTALREWRNSQATEESLPGYCVLSNAALDAIAVAQPASPHELLQIKGIGPAKLEQYGERVLELVAEHGDFEAASQQDPIVEESGGEVQAAPARSGDEHDRQRMPSNTTAAQHDDAPSRGLDETAHERLSPSERPSYYWTWLLVQRGFDLEECAQIRGLPESELRGHLREARNAGYRSAAPDERVAGQRTERGPNEFDESAGGRG